MDRMIVPAVAWRNDTFEMQQFRDSILEVAVQVDEFLKARWSNPVPGFRYFYGEKSRKASYVAATGERVVCFTVWDLTFGQAKLIDAKLSDVERWDLRTFRAAVARALGEPPRPLGRH
jgi:hypothetical protein